MSVFAELKRRNVFRVGIAYAVGAWLLLQFTEVLSELLNLPEQVGPVVVAVVAIGFPVVLFFAWAFELTPEGVKREENVDRSQSITSQTGKKLNTAITIMLAVALAYFIWESRFADRASGPSKQSGIVSEPAALETQASPATDRRSIAVLPFDNRSDQRSDAYFVEGIHDDLLTNLARIGSLKVISRTSVNQYKDTAKTIPQIADELGVATVMEGAVQRSGNTVRINVQLIDARTDEHLWAEIFDRELTAENLFAIQSEISEAIAAALKATLSPKEQQRIKQFPTDNLAAYDAFLRGRQLLARRTSADLQRAKEEFKRAVELDPGFALAWVGVADSHLLLAVYSAFSRADALPIQEEAIRRALAIDDELGEAYASLGTIHNFKGDPEAAEAAFKKAIELSPNYATAYHWYSDILRDIPQRVDESIDLATKALELDPNSSIIHVTLAQAYTTKGLSTLAEQQYRRVMDLDPTFAVAYRGLSDLYTYFESRYPDALRLAVEAGRLDPGNADHLFILLEVFLDIGDFQSADAVLERMEALDAEGQNALWGSVLMGGYQGNEAAFNEAINAALAKLSLRTRHTNLYALLEASYGHTERARDLYVRGNPGWLVPDEWPRLIREYPFDACLVSWVLMESEDEALGGALLDQATHYVDVELPSLIEHVGVQWPQMCYLAGGDTEKALTAIQTLVEHDHLIGWVILDRMPLIDPIRDDPSYLAAYQERDRKIAQMRSEIGAIKEDLGL